MSKLKEIISELSKPVPYEWRVQSKTKADMQGRVKAICTSFIDARTVQQMLDDVCAKFGATWDVDYKDVCGVIFAGITIQIEADKSNNVAYECSTRWDAGNRIEANETNKMYVQGGKSAASDAFKRAAVMFGVGRFLYDIAPMTLPFDGYNVVDDKGQKVYDLTTYIRGMAKKPQSKKKKPEAPKTETPAAPKLKKLTANNLDAMKKALEADNIESVEEAMPKYEMTIGQKEVLTTAITAAKAKRKESNEQKSN